MFRPALVRALPPVQWAPWALSARGLIACGVWLMTPRHLVSRLSMSGSVASLLLYAFMACAETAYRVSTQTVKRPE